MATDGAADGDDTFAEGLRAARDALGAARGRHRPRPRRPLTPPAPERPTVAPSTPAATDDDLRARVAALEEENRVLRLALADIRALVERTLPT